MGVPMIRSCFLLVKRFVEQSVALYLSHLMPHRPTQGLLVPDLSSLFRCAHPLILAETILCQDPHVQSAVIFGRGQFQNGVIIDPKTKFVFDPKDEARLAQFRNVIWSVCDRFFALLFCSTDEFT